MKGMKVRSNAIGLSVLAAALLTCGPALARYRVQSDNWLWNYYDQKWCLSAMTEFFECGYATFQQCNVARSGVGGTCRINPRYVERAPKPVHRRFRAHR